MASLSILSATARRLEGKVALITGGASGIGECTARLFSKHGAKVMIADIQDDLGLSVCKDLDEKYVSFVHCDVTNETHVINAVDAVVAQFGKLDIMYNNAGIVGMAKPNILDNDKDEFEENHPHQPRRDDDGRLVFTGLTADKNVDVHLLDTKGGNKIVATFWRHPYGRFMLLYSHGNAADLGQMQELFIELRAHLRVNIMCYDYSGYRAPSSKRLSTIV